ncbi:MAG: L,D-transpeptidase family protein, partial [Sphingomonas sp.]
AACMLASPALAAHGGGATMADTAPTLSPSDGVWNDDGGTGPLRIIVSLADQRAYVYRGDTMIAVSSVSSGRDGKETPTGEFPILQKQVDHRSTLYDSAPMPYMERLTWDGVAIHAGVTPGYRTSHGCIHVPLAFAKKLFSETKVGTVVDVVDSPVVLSQPAGQDDGAMSDATYADADSGATASYATTQANSDELAALND